MDYTVHGILQARIRKWVAFPFSRGSTQPKDQSRSLASQADSLPTELYYSEIKRNELSIHDKAWRNHNYILLSERRVSQSCLIICDPMDCSLPGSYVYGILQTRILEWVAIPFSRGSSCPGIEPRSPTLQADALLSEPPGNPIHSMLKSRDITLLAKVQSVV